MEVIFVLFVLRLMGLGFHAMITAHEMKGYYSMAITRAVIFCASTAMFLHGASGLQKGNMTPATCMLFFLISALLGLYYLADKKVYSKRRARWLKRHGYNPEAGNEVFSNMWDAYPGDN